MKKQFLTYNQINESLKISQYRKYHEKRPKYIENILTELFGGKNRIYIPFEYKVNNDDITINTFISMFFEDNGYTITDYLEGYCEKDGRTFRIGKVLNKLNRLDLLKVFNEDPNRTIQNKDFLICISKHPYDIAGMSTNRGWTSCMNLENGTQSKYLYKDINSGTIIAYLIEENDKNINRPYGRINIKPYTNIENEVAWGLAFKCYGSILDRNEKLSEKFKKELNIWIKENLNKDKYGTFLLASDVYPESNLSIDLGDNYSLGYILKKWDIDMSKLKEGVYEGTIIAPRDIKEFKGFEELLGTEIKEIKGDLYFGGCESLTSIANLPERIEYNLDFDYCKSLTTISKFPSFVGNTIFTYKCPFFEEMYERQIREKYNIEGRLEY